MTNENKPRENKMAPLVWSVNSDRLWFGANNGERAAIDDYDKKHTKKAESTIAKVVKLEDYDALVREVEELRAKQIVEHCGAPTTIYNAFEIEKAQGDFLAKQLSALREEIEKRDRADKVRDKCDAAEFAELREENQKYRKEIDKITKGIPSEWAYAILKKERDELRSQLDVAKEALRQSDACLTFVIEALGDDDLDIPGLNVKELVKYSVPMISEALAKLEEEK